MTDQKTPAFDHAILLMSDQDFINLPAWLTENFTILEGGEHTGQPSRNKLIVFSDGFYLELYNWFDTPPAENAWARKKPGLIDWALTSLPPLTADSVYSDLEARLHNSSSSNVLGITFTPPKAGGRTRKDGIKVQWKVTRPEFSSSSSSSLDKAAIEAIGGRLDAPFYCHDITPRSYRVDAADPTKTTHPCGAVGIHAVQVLVPEAEFRNYAELYKRILGVVPRHQKQEEEGEVVVFDLARLIQPSATSGGGAVPELRLRAAKTEGELAWLRERGAGISALVLLVGDEREGGEGEVPLGEDAVAKTVLLSR